MIRRPPAHNYDYPRSRLLSPQSLRLKQQSLIILTPPLVFTHAAARGLVIAIFPQVGITAIE